MTAAKVEGAATAMWRYDGAKTAVGQEAAMHARARRATKVEANVVSGRGGGGGGNGGRDGKNPLFCS